jgi:uncharacterized membrane protein YkvA (DUF1232 family)
MLADLSRFAVLQEGCGQGYIDAPGVPVVSDGSLSSVSVDVSLIVEIALGVAAVWVGMLILFLAFRPRDVGAREVVGVIPDVLRLLRAIIGDRSAPLDVRVILIGLVAWIVSPIDLIPEFIPVLGPLDDIVVAVVAMRYVRRRLGIDDLRTRWTGTSDGFELLVRLIGTG